MDKRKTNYAAIAEEMSRHLDYYFKKELERRSFSQQKNETRFNVLHNVAHSDYKQAINELNSYVDSKKEYPRFLYRSEAYVHYAKTLIKAIESKRNVSMLSNLSLARQQELLTKVVDHFEELTDVIKTINKMEKEEFILDSRSTLWVVKTFIHSLFVLTILGMIYEVFFRLHGSFNIVFDDFLYFVINKVSSLF